MKYFIYILYSDKLDKYYTGYTSDICKRLESHNLGFSKFTSIGVPWRLLYYEEYTSKREAIIREIEIKKKKSRRYIEEIIRSAGGRPDISGSLVGPAKFLILTLW